VVYTDVVTLSGSNGSFSTATDGATPGGFVPTVAGVYHWVASYSGDGNNNPVASGAGDEPETVSPASPQVLTTANPTGTVQLGTGSVTLNDSAVLSNLAGAGTGTLTFTLTDPSSATVYTDVVQVSGNGTYTTAQGNNPGGFTLPSSGTVVGTYTWHAHFADAGDNNPADDQGGTAEQVTITPASPAINTVTAGAGPPRPQPPPEEPPTPPAGHPPPRPHNPPP